ncbi:unnamed protein product [Cladocopium goreaui]|uniref:EF-hand domain-containing protein n=1 Tax=Cladocopium goreaui TaxID=2562237 RepID=A0A9P1FE60_9DINO|nr:unnamed protein product [Cladocopium goreaui]
MGSGVSAEMLANSSQEEVQKAYAEQSPEGQEKLKEALSKMGEKSSLCASPAQTKEPKSPSSAKRPLMDLLQQGYTNCQQSLLLLPKFEEMFGSMDADANGKVKVSELGPCADMMVHAVEGVESKEELMKQFDANGDGVLTKEEWAKVSEQAVKSIQSKMAKGMISRGDGEDWSEEMKPVWAELKAKIEKLV